VTFCHNDLGAEHLLVDVEASTITGVIDWTDAAAADPAHDLALIYRDLGPAIFDLTLAHYDGEWTDAHRERTLFYARCASSRTSPTACAPANVCMRRPAWTTSLGRLPSVDLRVPQPASGRPGTRRVRSPAVPRRILRLLRHR